LLADNYFHTVMEAVKSVADKFRARTGLIDDGAALVDRALTGDPPMLAINPLKTESASRRASLICCATPSVCSGIPRPMRRGLTGR
jgi:uncharacterized protein (TIGR02391 family)